MKILLDSCVWGGARAVLEQGGHDVVWAGDWAIDPGDIEILRRAHAEGRVLVTLDKDFGEFAVVHGQPHHGIVRLVDFAALKQGPACNELLARFGDELLAGALVTASPERVRIRPADPDDEQQ